MDTTHTEAAMDIITADWHIENNEKIYNSKLQAIN